MTAPDPRALEAALQRAAALREDVADLARQTAHVAEEGARVHDEMADVHEQMDAPLLDPAGSRQHAADDRAFAAFEREAADDLER